VLKFSGSFSVVLGMVSAKYLWVIDGASYFEGVLSTHPIQIISISLNHALFVMLSWSTGQQFPNNYISINTLLNGKIILKNMKSHGIENINNKWKNRREKFIFVDSEVETASRRHTFPNHEKCQRYWIFRFLLFNIFPIWLQTGMKNKINWKFSMKIFRSFAEKSTLIFHFHLPFFRKHVPYFIRIF
jgi:hypothetical protein